MNPILAALLQKYAIAGGLLILLVIVDLLTGVASALVRGVFHWSKVADTYRKTIVPVVLGWFAVSLLAEGLAFGLQAALAPEVAAVAAPLLAALAPGIFYALAFFRLLNSIYTNTQEITAGKPAAPQAPTPFRTGGKIENRTNELE